MELKGFWDDPEVNMEKREKKGNGNFMEHVTVGNRLRKEKYVLEEIPIDPVRKRQILGKIAEAV